VAASLDMLALDMHNPDSRLEVDVRMTRCSAVNGQRRTEGERTTSDSAAGALGGKSQCLRFGTGVRRPSKPRGTHVTTHSILQDAALGAPRQDMTT
jgi:hypothetical protein